MDQRVDPWPKGIKSVQITNGYFRLLCKQDDYGRKTQVDVEPNRKRCQKRLIKKGVMDVEYLKQVQEELMTSKNSSGMTPGGTRQLNHLVKSMAQRIQHGNEKRTHEKKIYHEMKAVNETKKLYSAPEPPSPYDRWNSRLIKEGDIKGVIDWKQSLQHEIKICLDYIENLKSHLKERESKVTRLKENLELVRKKISSLENANSKEKEGFKHVDKLGDQTILTYAEKLARKGVEGLKRVCVRDTKVELFVRRWCYKNGFRDDYDSNKLHLWEVYWRGLGDDYETRKLALMRG